MTRKGESLLAIANDPKVLNAISMFGSLGYAVVMKLEEMIHKTEDGLIPLTLLTYNRVAVELHSDLNAVTTVINELTRSGYIKTMSGESGDMITVKRAKAEVDHYMAVKRARGNTGGGRPAKKKPKYDDSFNEKYDAFIKLFNDSFGRSFKGDTRSKEQFHARLSENWTGDQFKIAMEAIKEDEYHKESKFKHVTPEFITRSTKLEKFYQTGKHKSGGESINISKRIGDEQG